MLQNKANKQEIDECKRLLIEINNRLNTRIKQSSKSFEETDRQALRTIRDMNIKTFLKIQKKKQEKII